MMLKKLSKDNHNTDESKVKVFSSLVFYNATYFVSFYNCIIVKTWYKLYQSVFRFSRFSNLNDVSVPFHINCTDILYDRSYFSFNLNCKKISYVCSNIKSFKRFLSL